MQQGFNHPINHRALPEHGQSALVLKQLAQWLGRQAAKKAMSEHDKPTETIH